MLDNLNSLDRILHSPRTTTQARAPLPAPVTLHARQHMAGPTALARLSLAVLLHTCDRGGQHTYLGAVVGLDMRGRCPGSMSDLISAASVMLDTWHDRQAVSPCPHQPGPSTMPVAEASTCHLPVHSSARLRIHVAAPPGCGRGEHASDLAILGVAAAQLFEGHGRHGHEAVVSILSALRLVSNRALPAAAQLARPAQVRSSSVLPSTVRCGRSSSFGKCNWNDRPWMLLQAVSQVFLAAHDDMGLLLSARPG